MIVKKLDVDRTSNNIPSIDSILTLTSIFNCDLDDIIASKEVEVML